MQHCIFVYQARKGAAPIFGSNATTIDRRSMLGGIRIGTGLSLSAMTEVLVVLLVKLDLDLDARLGRDEDEG